MATSPPSLPLFTAQPMLRSLSQNGGPRTRIGSRGRRCLWTTTGTKGASFACSSAGLSEDLNRLHLETSAADTTGPKLVETFAHLLFYCPPRRSFLCRSLSTFFHLFRCYLRELQAAKLPLSVLVLQQLLFSLNPTYIQHSCLPETTKVWL